MVTGTGEGGWGRERLFFGVDWGVMSSGTEMTAIRAKVTGMRLLNFSRLVSP